MTSKQTITFKQLEALLCEEWGTKFKRTEPFEVDRFEFTKTIDNTHPDKYDRVFTRQKDIIEVVERDGKRRWYVWTQSGDGKKVADELNGKFAGKTVTAEIRWNDRISRNKIKVEPANVGSAGTAKPEPPKNAVQKKPEQLTLGLDVGVDPIYTNPAYRDELQDQKKNGPKGTSTVTTILKTRRNARWHKFATSIA